MIRPGAAAVAVLASMTIAADSAPGRASLAPCPDTPNCVSSQTTGPARRVEPIAFAGGADAALARLKGVIAELPRARLVAEEGLRLRAEFTSRVFRFVDDVDFVIDPEACVIHVRSASRVGWYDFGVNRRRVEAIRRAFEAHASRERR